MGLKLYWYSDGGHEDWFCVARSAREVRKIVEDEEGQDPDDIDVELVMPLPAGMQDVADGWPNDDVLTKLGAKFLRSETPRVVELGGRQFAEGVMDLIVNQVNDDRLEAAGEGRPNGTRQKEEM